MGLLKQLRSSLENPQTPLSYPAEWLVDIFNGGRTDSGIRVSEGNAMQVMSVYACVRIIAESLAQLPLFVFERLQPRGQNPATTLDLFDLLHDEPNPEMSSFVFRETLQGHICLTGNAYAEIQRDNANRIIAFWPRNPMKTKPRRLSDGTLIYETTDGVKDGGVRKIAPDDMLHIPGLGFDGIVGYNPIQLSRQAIGLAMATEKYGAKFFGNGSRPGGVLQHPGKISDEASKRLKESWQAAQGGENSHKVAVLEEGITWQAVGISPEDSQFLETRKFQRSEIAAMFRVPPHMIADLDKATFSNIEQQSLEFVIYTLQPWITRWEHELNRKLFPQFGRNAGKFFVGFKVDALLRGDFKTMQEGIAIGRQWGYFSANDAREKIGENPIGPEGDIYLVPMNMVNAESVLDAEEQEPDAGNDDDETEPAQNSLIISRYVGAYYRLFRDAMGRILRRNKPDSQHFYRAFAPILMTIAEQISQQASSEFRVAHEIGTFGQIFLDEYLGGMAKRAANWTEEKADELAKEELGRAVRALMISVYRDVATAKAKQ